MSMSKILAGTAFGALALASITPAMAATDDSAGGAPQQASTHEHGGEVNT